jgi:hypothetical protein
MKMLCIFFIFLSSLAKASYETDTVKIRGNQSIAGNKTFTGNINLSALTGNCVLRSDGSDNLTCGGFDIDNSGNLTGVDGIFSGSVNANLILEMVSTTKASKPCPEMTTTQRDALTPVNGSCIYNSTTLSYQFYNGTSWGDIGGGVSATALNNKRVWFYATTDSGQICFDDNDAGVTLLENNQRIEMEDEIVDTDSLYDPTTGRFTITASTVGYYQCCAKVTAQGSAFTAGDNIRIAFGRNATTGTYHRLIDYDEFDGTVTRVVVLNGCEVINMTTAGDYIELRGGMVDGLNGNDNCSGSQINNYLYCMRVDGKDF